jgi:hypothetical protein
MPKMPLPKDQMNFGATDRMGMTPDLKLIGRRYKHQNGLEYIVGGWSWDADRQRWMIGYRNAGCPVVMMRLPEEFFGMHNGRPRYTAIQ